ncbi:MAG: ABC-F family ATP-binding cassette domain-containing protein, partial [Phycisphaerae bacterium]|nr:ABC-F family ATP-binding cassette domain-containing protein [Phycisphaerae bacterium]
NVLVLDEPTNHLDIPAREALEDALLEFSGAVLVVSHDRYLLDRIVDHLLVIRPEGHAAYPGNYSYYIEQVEQRERDPQAAQGTKPTRKRRSSAPGGTTIRPKPSPFARSTLDELEAMIVERETRIGEIEQAFGAADVCRDPVAVERLRTEFASLQTELRELHAAWEAKIDGLGGQ